MEVSCVRGSSGPGGSTRTDAQPTLTLVTGTRANPILKKKAREPGASRWTRVRDSRGLGRGFADPARMKVLECFVMSIEQFVPGLFFEQIEAYPSVLYGRLQG